jgi:hypothetical protein
MRDQKSSNRDSGTDSDNAHWLRRLVRRMDSSELLWIFGLLMVGYSWGFFWGVCFQKSQEIQINREIITGDIVAARTGMSADNAVLRENLDEWIVGRKCDLVTVANKLHQDTSALVWQSIAVLNSPKVNLSAPLKAAPPIDKPANNNQWRNSCQKPSCNGMPHSANPPNEKS